MTLWDFNILVQHWDQFMAGLGQTILASLLGLIGDLVLGTLIAILRIAPFRILKAIGAIYVEFIRNIPLLVVVFSFPGPALSRHTGGPVYFGYAWANGVYGRLHCRSHSGGDPGGTLRTVGGGSLLRAELYPEYALHRSSTGDQNRIAGHRQPIDQSGQNSSVLGVIAGLDLMYYADLINLSTFKGIPVYTFVALFYLLLTIPLSLAVHYMERRFARSN